jgi:hypothetical protein
MLYGNSLSAHGRSVSEADGYKAMGFGPNWG